VADVTVQRSRRDGGSRPPVQGGGRGRRAVARGGLHLGRHARSFRIRTHRFRSLREPSPAASQRFTASCGQCLVD